MTTYMQAIKDYYIASTATVTGNVELGPGVNIWFGCVIRGGTAHSEIVWNESARGITQLAIEHKAAIGNGIVVAKNEAQAHGSVARLRAAGVHPLSRIPVRQNGRRDFGRCCGRQI